MAAPVMMAASTAMKTVGGVVSGLSAASAADQQASVDRQNAVLASDQAGQREEQIRRQGRQTLGEQAADVAQSGIGFTQSTRDTMDQSAANLSLDALNTRYQGTIQTTNDMNQAKADAAKAHALRLSTWIGAGTNALGGLSKYLGAGGGLPGMGAAPAMASADTIGAATDAAATATSDAAGAAGDAFDIFGDLAAL